MNFKLGKINQKEIITCILLVIAGYMFAEIFTRMNAGFRIGGQSVQNYCKGKCLYGTYPYPSKQDICNKVSQANCEKTWYKNTAKGGSGNTEIGIGCYWNEAGKKCVTPGTGFKSAGSCPQTKCSYSPPSKTPTPPGKTPTPTPPGKTPTPTPPGKTPTPPGKTPSKYSCSGSKCIADNNGTYTSSNCNNKCDSSIWTSWWMIMIYIIVGLSFILLIGFSLSS